MLKPLVRRLSSFTYLNFTQFTGALNDNIFKLLIVYLFIDLEGIDQKYNILASTGALFVLPFLLFSTSSGTLADRFSKRNIIIYTKILEVFIMLLGVFAFYYQSKMGTYAILFLMATQSAIFGPSKYGILPEIVSSDKITKANGLMSSFTFLAIILGTFLASVFPDIFGRNFTYGAIICFIISLFGLLASFCIEYTPPAESEKRFNPSIFREIADTLKIAKQHPSLLVTIFGSAFFLFLGAYVQLNLIPFAIEFMHLSDNQGGYLFLLMAVGIAGGSILAGKISGPIVELGLVPIAGLSVAICCYLIDMFSSEFYIIPPLIVLLGFFGGMYQIPLDSYIQVASPHKYRGQIVATTNFMSFFGVLIASGLMFLVNEILKLNADKGFVIVGTITMMVTLVIGFQFFDYLSRFIAMILSRLHFKTTLVGRQNIPETPAVYVCSHTAWNDTLLILGAQRRRVRFFIEQEQYHSKWMIKLYRLLRVVMVPGIEPLEDSPICLSVIRKTLQKGISVCIFVSQEDICTEIERLKNAYAFQQILKENQYPLIPVAIEKGEKDQELKSRFLTRLLEKFRVPALLSFGSQINDPVREEGSDEDLYALV
jgi:acyl-[acyl-carrier-protein]-phospholipid O-acyltransferase / long-chain-fatty-acid--[acyl-carrier-protein] ligase